MFINNDAEGHKKEQGEAEKEVREKSVTNLRSRYYTCRRILSIFNAIPLFKVILSNSGVVGGDLTSSGACEGSFSMIIIDRKLFCERTIFSRRIEIVSLILNSRHPTPETKGGYRISPPLFFLACTIAGALQVTASYTFVFNWWPVIAADRDRVDQRRKNISTDIVFNSVCLTIILFSNFRKKSQGIRRAQAIGGSIADYLQHYCFNTYRAMRRKCIINKRYIRISLARDFFHFWTFREEPKKYATVSGPRLAQSNNLEYTTLDTASSINGKESEFERE